eukprot:TRINITY_DN11494_c0_g2_i1.p1 TRINITY_DN11494_c0_g2~~TRINITY_DN11494_c0_g2_i1.p1  ORF type:complete len:679 (+),score=164.35 TRINITY_DN11494_c0_g2_i1:51-2039(+)
MSDEPLQLQSWQGRMSDEPLQLQSWQGRLNPVERDRLQTDLSRITAELDHRIEGMSKFSMSLENQPKWVQDAILNLVAGEYRRSWQQVFDGVNAYYEVIHDLDSLWTADDVRILRELCDELSGKDLKELERIASWLDRDANNIILCIQERDFQSIVGIAERFDKTMREFCEKYRMLQPIIGRIQDRLATIKGQVIHNKHEAQRRKDKTEQHRDFWFDCFAALSSRTSMLANFVLAASLTSGVASTAYTHFLLAPKAHAAAASLASAKAEALAKSQSAAAALAATGATNSSSGITTGVTGAASAVGGAGMASPELATLGIGLLAGGVGVVIWHVLAASATASASAAAAKVAQQAVQSAAATAAAASAAEAAGLAIASTSFFASLGAVLVLALLYIGDAKRETLKKILGSLWEKELRIHGTTIKAFEDLEARINIFEEFLGSLAAKHQRVLENLSLVRDLFEECRNEAQRADEIHPAVGPVAENDLQTSVEDMNEIVSRLQPAAKGLLVAVCSLGGSLRGSGDDGLASNANSAEDGLAVVGIAPDRTAIAEDDGLALIEAASDTYAPATASCTTALPSAAGNIQHLPPGYYSISSTHRILPPATSIAAVPQYSTSTATTAATTTATTATAATTAPAAPAAFAAAATTATSSSASKAESKGQGGC